VPDNPPNWSGRAHAVLLLPVDDEPELLIDIPYYDSEGIALSRIRDNSDMIGGLVELIRERGLASAWLGLVGTDVIPTGWYWQLSEQLPDTEWLPASHILDKLRAVKSPAEQALIREVAARGVAVMGDLLAAVKPGATEGHAAGAGLMAMATRGMMPYELHIAGGPDAHQYTRARMPSWDSNRPLEPGDMFHVDLMAAYMGYYTDFARTVIVGGGKPSVEQERLMRAARDSVYGVIDAIRPGVRGRELAAAGYNVLERYGLANVSDVSHGGKSSAFAGFGHSLGLQWEGPWLDSTSDETILPGMYLAIEKTVGVPGVGGATFEENVLVTDDGVEVLTSDAPQGF
jgi:Xaa-Pro aminopeptidase